MSGNDIARVYASSLIDVGRDNDALQVVEEEMEFLINLYREEDDFQNFLTNPGFSREQKDDLIDRVFKGNLSEHTVNFLHLLIENDRQVLLEEIYESCLEQLDEIYRRMRVVVTTSKALNEEMRSSIMKRLKDVYDREIILEEKVDESILGGIQITLGDLVIDGSLAKDLKNIRNNLITRKIRSEVAYED